LRYRAPGAVPFGKPTCFGSVHLSEFVQECVVSCPVPSIQAYYVIARTHTDTHLDGIAALQLARIRLRSVPRREIKHAAVTSPGSELHMVRYHACGRVAGSLGPPHCRAGEATLPSVTLLTRVNCVIPRKPCFHRPHEIDICRPPHNPSCQQLAESTTICTEVLRYGGLMSWNVRTHRRRQNRRESWGRQPAGRLDGCAGRQRCSLGPLRRR